MAAVYRLKAVMQVEVARRARMVNEMTAEPSFALGFRAQLSPSH